MDHQHRAVLRLAALAAVAAMLVPLSAAVPTEWDEPSDDMEIPDYELLALPDFKDLSPSDLEKKAPKKKIKQTSNVTATITSSNTTTVANQRPSNRGCNCVYGICTCCTGALLDIFRQKACMKVAYTPEDFAFDLSMLVNNRTMYTTKVSGKNPPPACVGLPRTGLRLCARLTNIYFAGRNLHMCMGFEGKWDYSEIFKIEFDCIRMGSEGFAVVKPEEGGGISPGVPGGLDAVIDAGGDEIGDYDENVVRSNKNQEKS